MGDQQDQPADGQERIWEFFQNRAPHSFGLAKPRLDYLIRETARRFHGSKPSLLTVGTGDGYLERSITATGWDLVALDPDEESVARLNQVGIRAERGYMEDLPFADATFDCIIASEVLEHLGEDRGEAAIREVRRVLRPGGWFLGTVPYGEDLAGSTVVCPHCGEIFHRWGHQRSFNERSLANELHQCFPTVEVRRIAFVEFRGRNLRGKAKSMARWVLGRLGEPIASPNIFFAAR